jgi:hypothetical protein
MQNIVAFGSGEGAEAPGPGGAALIGAIRSATMAGL